MQDKKRHQKSMEAASVTSGERVDKAVQSTVRSLLSLVSHEVDGSPDPRTHLVSLFNAQGGPFVLAQLKSVSIECLCGHS